MNCPFFGVVLVDIGEEAPVLLPSKDQRCGLIINPPDKEYAPCVMEIAGEEVAWTACVYNPVNNGTFFDTGIPAGESAPIIEKRQIQEPETDAPETVEAKMQTARQVSDRFRELRKADPVPLVERVIGSGQGGRPPDAAGKSE